VAQVVAVPMQAREPNGARMRYSLLTLVVAFAIAFTGCNGDGSNMGSGGAGGAGCGDGPDIGDLPCDVAAILTARCQSCHQNPPQGGAHFPLLTYEDTHRFLGMTGKHVWQRMAEVIEPEGLPHMPYKSAPQLDNAQLTVLRDWFNTCAPPEPETKGCDIGE
jgi:hypothetical protein